MSGATEQETALVQFPVWRIRPAVENHQLYNQFSVSNADDEKLVRDVRENGVLTPLHISLDGVLLDGHRRLAAAREVGLESVPCITVIVVYESLSSSERLTVLRRYNHQREKSFDERTAEALADIDPEQAYQEVISYRAQRSLVNAESNVEMGAFKRRAKITTKAFLEAVIRIVYDERDNWPISNRAVHYALLNDPPLTHDSKPNSHYRNQSSKPNYPQKLSNLLTRARLEGHIPMEAICDDERPVTVWDVYQQASDFVREQNENFLQGYARDLMQSQPHHIEVVVEKRTKFKAASRVAGNYTIPVLAGKGFASLAPRYEMFKRYKASGKDKLVLIFLTDFDPDGEQIASSFARSMRDEFGVSNILPIKAGLTHEQVLNNDLPSSLEAKADSANYKRFVKQYGTRAVELEAMPAEMFDAALKTAIESVLDTDAFNYEVEREKQESARISAMKRAATVALGAKQ